MTTANKPYEYFFIVLILLGILLEGAALYIDATAPNFYLALDLEIAGLALIVFGFVGDFLYSHS